MRITIDIPDNLPLEKVQQIIQEIETKLTTKIGIKNQETAHNKKSFAEVLDAIPNVGLDSDFERKEDNGNRNVFD